MAVELKEGGTYSFDVYPVPILGSGFKNVKILAVMGYGLAAKLSPIDARHYSVKPYIQDLPSSPNLYSYVQIETKAGITDIIGIPWIRADTIVEEQARTRTFRVAGVQPGDDIRIKNELKRMGYNNVEFVD